MLFLRFYKKNNLKAIEFGWFVIPRKYFYVIYSLYKKFSWIWGNFKFYLNLIFYKVGENSVYWQGPPGSWRGIYGSEELDQSGHDWLPRESFPGKWIISLRKAHKSANTRQITSFFGESLCTHVLASQPDQNDNTN